MYQKNLNHLELYQCDAKSHVAHKMLMSRFNPAGVSLSPSKDAFIFLDNGRLKFKKLIKRSPGSFDFSDPIYNFHTISWLDDESFFFSARCGIDRFAIFLASLQNRDIVKIIYKPDVDCMYPLAINNKLYFIERECDKSGQRFCIVKYDLLKDGSLDISSRKTVANLNDQPIAFLISLGSISPGSNGIAFIKYREIIGESSNIHLTLVKVLQDKPCEDMLSFDLPIDLLDRSEFSLFESILPFLPRVFGDIILFSSLNNQPLSESVSGLVSEHGGKTSIFSYNVKTGKICALDLNSWSTNYFSPIKRDAVVICGGTVGDSVQINQNDDGETTIILPQCYPVLY